MTIYICARNYCILKNTDGFKPNPTQCKNCTAFCVYEPKFEPYQVIGPDCPYFEENGEGCPDRYDLGGDCIGCDNCPNLVWIKTQDQEDNYRAWIDYLQGGE